MNLVFAYGSLINRKEIEKTLKTEDAEKDYFIRGIGKLDDYKLAFTRYSSGWRGGVLDVITSQHDYVLGLVLEVSNRALRAIDRREGVGTGAYMRKTVRIQLDREVMDAYIYTVVDKKLSGIVFSEEYINKVKAGMREEGFPEVYISKYLLGQKIEDSKINEETVLRTLRFIRKEPHAVDLFTISSMVGVKLWDIHSLVDYLITGGFIRQDRRNIVDKYDPGTKYYTVPEKREKIDRILLEDEKKSLKPFESIDCINADLNHKTKACMHCLSTYKGGKTFCRKCLNELNDIDTPMLDIIFELNKKGYKTEFCCSGHPKPQHYFAYFVLTGIIDGLTSPDGFSVEYEDNRTIITSLDDRNIRFKLSSVELKEVIEKNLSNLREWVKELPDQLHN